MVCQFKDKEKRILQEESQAHQGSSQTQNAGVSIKMTPTNNRQIHVLKDALPPVQSWAGCTVSNGDVVRRRADAQ